MSQILEFYQDNKENDDIYKLAKEYILIDTLSKNLKGINKIKDIDGMNMEASLSNNIIPGMIYTFTYKSSKDKTDIDNLNFGDNMPLLLCCKINKVDKVFNNKVFTSLNVQGLNLNLLDKKYKLLLLDNIQNFYYNFYHNDVYNSVLNDKVIINNDLAANLQDINYIKTLSSVIKYDLSTTYRSYILSNCKNIRLIEYNLWKYIPFYNPSRIISNLNNEQLKHLSYILNL